VLPRCARRRRRATIGGVPTFRLHHRHEAHECRVVYAAWRGFDSPLRRAAAVSSCREGGHAIWWDVEARDGERALALLPPYVASRTTALAVSEVVIP
jgi:hypothetical protein